ncbi:MAG: DUF2764 family protein [Candidatus Omnitrophica bacterium]|nr:DUF2764 family protein [Candidatus Omnitrophota bacterium]
MISSLPMLHFGMKPPFSLERFKELCRRLIPEKDLEVIDFALQKEIHYYKEMPHVLKEWVAFDTTLKNELVKIRAGHRKEDPSRYTRESGSVEISLMHLISNATRNPSLIESERMLDMEKWRKLEELSLGHYFDLEILVIYALKLGILGRWENIRSADKTRLIEEALQVAL